MSWGKKDERLSKMLYENGLFLDKRSRVVYDPEMNPHLKLKGQDMRAQRDRLANKAEPVCGICGKDMPLYSGYWETHHKQGGLVGRCDCLHNLTPVHIRCHKGEHVQVQLKSIGAEP